jgi:hypothetical protein
VDLNDSPFSRTDLDYTPHATDNNCLALESEQPQSNQITAEEDPEELPCLEFYDDQEDFADEDVLPPDQDPECGDFDTTTPLPSIPTEDDLDPFLVNRHPTNTSANILDVPD